jgi:arabinogalactan endo-1,4-beta-galactosidase
MANLTSVIADVQSRYGRPVVVVETAAPFTTANADRTGNSITGTCPGYPATWEGQGAAFTAVQQAAKAGGAIGVFYWEPTWYAVPGNGWDPNDIANSGDGWDNMAVFNWTGVFNDRIRWIS